MTSCFIFFSIEGVDDFWRIGISRFSRKVFVLSDLCVSSDPEP